MEAILKSDGITQAAAFLGLGVIYVTALGILVCELWSKWRDRRK